MSAANENSDEDQQENTVEFEDQEAQLDGKHILWVFYVKLKKSFVYFIINIRFWIFLFYLRFKFRLCIKIWRNGQSRGKHRKDNSKINSLSWLNIANKNSYK